MRVKSRQNTAVGWIRLLVSEQSQPRKLEPTENNFLPQNPYSFLSGEAVDVWPEDWLCTLGLFTHKKDCCMIEAHGLPHQGMAHLTIAHSLRIPPPLFYCWPLPQPGFMTSKWKMLSVLQNDVWEFGGGVPAISIVDSTAQCSDQKLHFWFRC